MEKINDELKLTVDIELSKRSFYFFVKEFWSEVDTHDLIDNWVVECVCDHLQAVYEGDLPNLVINIPPGFGKSLLGSVLFPAWIWVRDPSYSIFSTTRDNSNLKRDAMRFFNLISSKKFRLFFGNLFKIGEEARSSKAGEEKKISSDNRDIQNDKKGYRIAKTTGSSATGARGKIRILDDPNDRKDAFSAVEREKINDYVSNTLSTRTFSKFGGGMVIIMQRLHEDDVAGKAIEKGYHLLKLPMEQNGRGLIPLKKWKDPRNEGEFLEPRLFDAGSKETLLKDLSLKEYEGQYQQEPRPLEGNVIKKEWFKTYYEIPSGMHLYCQSWDLAFKGDQSSDYVVGTVWGVKGSSIYLLDIVRDKFTFSQTIDAFNELSEKWPFAMWKIIENKANAFALQDTLQNTVPGIELWNPKTGKLERLMSVEPLFRAGNVFFPDESLLDRNDKHGVNLIRVVKEELLVFPNGKNDDTVDSLTQALINLSVEMKVKTEFASR